jgi:ribosomal protein S28E/S33
MDSHTRYALITDIIGRTGSRGGITQVKVNFFDDRFRF